MTSATTMEEAGDTPLRAKVGSYVLVRRIGSGGTADVWLGRNEVSGGIAAVKVIARRAGGAAAAAMFQREARIVASLAHPHIVPLFELGDDFVVMPYIDGTTLARRLATPMPPALAVRIVGQVAQALDHAHARGVVHRDVKPSNILLDQQETAFLADFGVAAAIDDPAARAAGTPRYMAPEQVRRERVGPAADQYALGLTLLEALGSEVGADVTAAIERLPAELPRELRDVIARATAAEARDRFPSMAELARALFAVDLAGMPAAARLQAAWRAVDPHPWLVHAWREERITDDLVRGDFRLSELVAARAVDPERARALLEMAGLRDLGFSAYLSVSRVGALADPAVSARVAEVIALIHGWSATRTTWRYLAPALSRDNALALVITPDLYGFGESRFRTAHGRAGLTGRHLRDDDPPVAAPAARRAADGARRALGVGDGPLDPGRGRAAADDGARVDHAALPGP